jgi:hypothetical protein
MTIEALRNAALIIFGIAAVVWAARHKILEKENAMTSPFDAIQDRSATSDQEVLESLLMENINWHDSDTGTAVEAILTHFMRRTT